MEPDVLAGFTRETLPLAPDREGEVVATLVSKPASGGDGRAVLYLHGYVDYFFQEELAERYNQHGFDFYALDLRKYGRSLLPHQTPNFCVSLTEYFEEIDEAVGRIRDRDEHSFLLLNGHSTGGLIAALYAHERRGAGTVDACFLNSPFFAMNVPWLSRHVLLPVVSAVGAVAPRLGVPSGLSSLYAQSLHRDHHGEWDFNREWKPIEGFPTKAGWLRAIRKGQRQLHEGLDIDCPVLVMYSARSSWNRRWDDILLETDAVLDVADIERYSKQLGSRVTEVRIPGGMHDLVLSAKPVRDEVYDELFAWLRTVTPSLS